MTNAVRAKIGAGIANLFAGWMAWHLLIVVVGPYLGLPHRDTIDLILGVFGERLVRYLAMAVVVMLGVGLWSRWIRPFAAVGYAVVIGMLAVSASYVGDWSVFWLYSGFSLLATCLAVVLVVGEAHEWRKRRTSTLSI